jgi:carboxylesterase
MEPLTLLPRTEPFFHPGNRVGCLVIHGFTGAPQEMRELGGRLAAQGYTVSGPRLAHHGTHPADMNRSQWRDWYFSALDGYQLLRAHCDHIIPIGLSMGGATALLMAAWEEVTAVVAMAAPAQLVDDWRLRYTRQAAAIYPFDPPITPEWKNTFLDPHGRTSYPVNPIGAVAELSDYLAVVRQHLPQVTVPALLIHSADDPTVAPLNMSLIAQQLGSASKQTILLEEGGHVITESATQKEAVFTAVCDFVQKVTPTSA